MAQVRESYLHEKELYSFIIDEIHEANRNQTSTVVAHPTTKPDLKFIQPLEMPGGAAPCSVPGTKEPHETPVVIPPLEMPACEEGLICEELVLNVGPQHPSTHGVFRAIVWIDGERITRIEPQIGYLHRCFEKIAENRTYSQFMPYTDRMDYVSAMLSSWGYAMAVEDLAGIDVPERAEYLRVIVGELNRIASHLVYLSCAGLDTGAMTPFFWVFEDRENILDLFEAICGARQTYNYMRIGGVSNDSPEGWLDGVRGFIKTFETHLKDYEKVLIKNYIFKKRMVDVGVLPAAEALALGATGPVLRASGVASDLRKDEPYSVYSNLEFDIPLGINGDNYDRTTVRFEEMWQSCRMILQAIDQISDGPVFNPGIPRLLCPAPGEAIGRIESSKGELGFYVVSDGGPKPYRVKIQAPSYANLQLLPAIATGSYIADMIAILGTLDPVFGEVDR